MPTNGSGANQICTGRLLQASLKELGYFGGAIDGKDGGEFGLALSKFQFDNGLKPDGLMRPGGPTNLALDAQLSEGSVCLNATTLRKTHEVFIVGNSQRAKSEEPFKDFPFDDKKLGLMRYALTIFSDEFWIPLQVDNDSLHIDDDGKATATLHYPDHIRWLDHGNQVKAMKSTPVDALELLVQELNFSFWNLSIVGGDVKIEFTERVKVESISKYEGAAETASKHIHIYGTDVYYVRERKSPALRVVMDKIAPHIPQELVKPLKLFLFSVMTDSSIYLTTTKDDIEVDEKDHYVIKLHADGIKWIDNKTKNATNFVPKGAIEFFAKQMDGVSAWSLPNTNEMYIKSTKTYKQKYKLFLVARRYMSYDSGGDFSTPGHLFIGFINSKGEKKAHGFYPGRHNTLTDKFKYEGKNLKGLVKNDTDFFKRALAADSEYRFMKYTVTKQQYETALSKIKSYDLTYDYGLFERSCVHAAIETLTSAGVLNILTISDGTTPYSLYKKMPANRGFRP